MNARTTFPELPLDGGATSTPPLLEGPVVEGEAASAVYHPDYLRLFGNLTPEQVITALPSDPDAARLGASPPAFTCDPIAGGEAPFYSPALHDVARLRGRHIAKGHTPESDGARGSAWFGRAANQAWHDATRARAPENRRKLLIIAAAIVVAQIDAEDFQSTQEPTP